MAYVRQPGQVCPRCKRYIKQRAQFHIDKCLQLPTAEEFAAMLDANEYESMLSLSEKYNVGLKRVRDIVLAGNTHWNEEKIKERSRHARYQPQRGVPKFAGKQKERPRRVRRVDYRQGRFDCAKGCGVLVQKAGDICNFCFQEQIGIRNQQDILAMSSDDPRLAIVRKGYHSYPHQSGDAN